MTQEVITGAGEIVAPALEIRIARDFQPTFDDMVTLEDMQVQVDTGARDADGKPIMRPAATWRDVRALFNRAIVGGSGHLPVDGPTMSAIGQALKAHFEAKANPNG